MTPRTSHLAPVEMMGEKWALLQEAFHAALEMRNAEERRRSIEAHLSGRPELMAEVLEMLQVHDRQFSLKVESKLVTAEESRDQTGVRIDHYELLRLIGRGGMGEVYAARRSGRDLGKLVAIKLLPDFCPAEMQAMFRLEQKILARLDHPNIVPLLDGGVTGQGKRYLVMPLVEGKPVTEYSRSAGLAVAQRLRLFLEIGRAVEHAHRNLVVHRDLKPSNILITEQGQVRLLDFGIAKLLEPEAEAAATRTELRLMTPEYASPEQILGEPVTTATDVHGMGVLLYELLAGVRPYEGSRRHDLERRIVEEDPLPPGKTAQGKQAGLNADLDAIVLKALEKNPAARYGSAVALMADVERYLGKRPVLARPPSWSYRAGRFVSRNRAASALGLACLLLVAGSAAISTYQSRLVRSERDAARSEHKKSETVVAVLTELLGAASPRQVPGAAEMTASEFLNRAEKLVVESRGMDAEVQARLRHVLGEVYRARSQYERARGHLESAWRQLRAIHGDSHEDAARAARDLARLVAQAGPPEQAIEMLRRSMDQMKSIYGESSRETAGAMRDLGSALSGARQKHLLTESLRIERSLGGAKPAAGVASALDALGRYHLSRGEVHEAGKYFDEAAGIFQATLPDGHPDTLAAMNNAITAHARLGEVKLAAQMHRGLIERQAKYLGENHIQVAHSYGNLGVALAEGGRYNEAGEAMRENIGRLRAILGKDHPQVASAVRNMARIMQMQGRYREALALMDQALGSLRPAPQPDAQAGLMRAQRAVLLLRTGRTREGRQLLEEAVATLRKMNPGGHYAAADGSVMLAFSLLARGEHHRAALLFDEAAAFRGAHLPAGHPKVAEAACGQALSRKAGWPDLQPCAAYQRWPLADPEDKKIAASLIASRGGHR